MIKVAVWAALVVSGGALRAPSPGKIAVIGASGGTGQRAVLGLLDDPSLLKPSDLRVLSRDPSKPACSALRRLGVETVRADLDEPASLEAALAGARAVYVHGTGAEAKQADLEEVPRAKRLAAAMRAAGVPTAAYNSAADPPSAGIDRAIQKRDVEQAFADAGIGGVDLRATLFMEELWKSYTRPAVLRGKFPFSVPPDRPVSLTCVRDMGRLAAAALCGADGAGDSSRRRAVDVASDVLTPAQIAAAFGTAQGGKVAHQQNRALYYASRVLLPELYRITRHYRKTHVPVDVAELEAAFPGLALTRFAAFLEETGWADTTRAYADLAL